RVPIISDLTVATNTGLSNTHIEPVLVDTLVPDHGGDTDKQKIKVRVINSPPGAAIADVYGSADADGLNFVNPSVLVAPDSAVNVGTLMYFTITVLDGGGNATGWDSEAGQLVEFD